jgi:hypothetical protein
MNKRNIVVFLMIIGINLVFGQSQSSPIIGYDRLQWGAGIQIFQQIYSSTIEITTLEESAMGIRIFKQENLAGGITERRFNFFENKFYRVYVDYGTRMAMSSIEVILERLISIYGRFDRRENKQEATDDFLAKTTDLYRYYNSDLTIYARIIEFYNLNNYKIGTAFSLNYVNPAINDEASAERRRRLGDEFSL